MLISDRTHNTSYRQTVKIVINKNQNTKCNGSQLCSGAGLDMFAGPASECSRTACLIHQTHDCSQDNQENQNADVVTVRQHTYNTVLENVNDSSFKTKA